MERQEFSDRTNPDLVDNKLQFFPITFACGLKQGWPFMTSRIGQMIGEINQGKFRAECVLHGRELVIDIYYLKSKSQEASEI